ncbi:MAG: hypothetical protein PHV06_03920, partial [bacterium]|nr:hypothetical protein [bacterium]
SSQKPFEFNPEVLVNREFSRAGFNPLIFKIWIKPDREKHFKELLQSEIPELNSDLNPKLFIKSIMVWGELNNSKLFEFFSFIIKNGKIILIIPGIIIIFIFLWVISDRRSARISPRNISWSLITTGITAISFELLCIYLFQVIFGNIYVMIGILTGTFLFGISAGAFFGVNLRGTKENYLLISEAAIVFLCLINFAFSDKIIIMYKFFSVTFILLNLFVLGFFAGLEFPLGSELLIKTGEGLPKIISSLLISDMSGAMLGSFLLSIFIVPVMGIKGAFGVISIINVSSFFCLIFRMFIIRRA